MKTAMEELIEMMNDAKEKGFKNLDWLMLIRTYSLLEKEKKQIIDAFDENNSYCSSGSVYYDQTYQTK